MGKLMLCIVFNDIYIYIYIYIYLLALFSFVDYYLNIVMFIILT